MITEIFIFIFGLIIGSFLNCVIYRLETKKSFLRGRSFCPKCKQQLAWYDLIPVLSYFILAAKCRYCKKKISVQYPLVELATGVLFVALANFDHFFQTFYFFIIISFLVVIFVYDLKSYIIPDKVVLPAIALALAYNLFSVMIGDFTWQVFWGRILAGFWPALGFFLLFFVSQGKWMGFGDVKLAFLMGLVLGPVKVIVALYLAFILGGIISLVLVISRKKNMKSEIPFGPFLVTGTFLAMIFSSSLLGWYYNLL
jgi:leader peptidase (prepilin peptidase)/N-methyltransferase